MDLSPQVVKNFNQYQEEFNGVIDSNTDCSVTLEQKENYVCLLVNNTCSLQHELLANSNRNSDTMALQTQASHSMTDDFSLLRLGADLCGLDDLVSQINDEDHLNTALLQEHAELLGLNLNTGMFTASKYCNNLNSPPNGIWPQAKYAKDRNQNPDFISQRSAVCIDNIGFSEKLKQAHHPGPNFPFNAAFDHENGNMLSLNSQDIYQVPRHPKDIFTPDGNNCNYKEWEDFSALQKSEANDMFNDPEFRFPDMDNNPVAEHIDQQCFWTKDFGKQVSEALNMATSAASWTPLSVSLSFPKQASNQINSSIPTQAQYNDLLIKQESEQPCNEDVQMMLINEGFYAKDEHQRSKKGRPISSLSSSSTESPGDIMLNPNILSITNISEVQDCLSSDSPHNMPAMNPCSAMKSSISKVNRNAHLNQVSQAYQNFPRNLSSRYNTLQKNSMPPQTASDNDYGSPLNENIAPNSYNFENVPYIKNAHNLDKLQFQRSQQTHPNAPGFCCLKQPELLKNCIRGNNMSCLEKNSFLPEHEKPMGATNSNRFPLSPEVLQHLSARTIAGLYAFGLYHDMLHPEVNNCEGGSLSLPSGMKYPPHIFSSSPITDSVFEVYHPYDFVHRRGPSSVYGTNDVFFGQTPFFSVPPTVIGMRPLRRSGPSNELHLRLEECYEQFRHLEKERKKTEAELARQNPGKKVSSTNTLPIPRLTANPSRVDRLIIDELREHAKVITLIAKMEQLRKVAVHPNIHMAMERWLEAIRNVQARRRDEIINVANRQRSSTSRIQEDKDVVALATSIMELTKASRQARTSMWCALITTILFNIAPEVASAHSLPPDLMQSNENGTPFINVEMTSKVELTHSKENCNMSNVSCEKKEIPESPLILNASDPCINTNVNNIYQPSVDEEGAPNLHVDIVKIAAP